MEPLAREWQKKLYESSPDPEPQVMSGFVLAALTAAVIITLLVTARPPFVETAPTKPFLRKTLNIPLIIAIACACAGVVAFVDSSMFL